MNKRKFSNSEIIDGIAFGFSAFFLLSALVGAIYTGEWGCVFRDWFRIMTSPCPLVTDYFALGGLGSAMLNAGVCGMSCFLFMHFLPGDSRANTLAGFFLVVAHCFYGLNFLNMWPCFLSVFLYLHYHKLNYKDNLHICMFATSFGPFMSEFLFRYTQESTFELGHPHLTVSGIVIAVIVAVALGYVIPAILPGALLMHKGYNLYNGGLAFGLLGFFIFNFMYKTLGVEWIPAQPSWDNGIYQSFAHSFNSYANIFFLISFSVCIGAGFWLNGQSFNGLEKLVMDTGYRSDFAEKYGMPLCLINLGIYGMFFLAYLNMDITLTQGVGYTGPTFGVIIASLTFVAMGQHPGNVWPILAGYELLYIVTAFFCYINGRDMTWSVSSQAYINGVAFATGLSPIVGRYGRRAGILAGFVCASMCTSTAALHGGFVLYNGGFTAGITALILVPILEHYFKPRDQIEQVMIWRDMITVQRGVDSNYYREKERLEKEEQLAQK